jgi:hypothetical protein
MPVSHEAIYTWIYAHPKGELARAGIVLQMGCEPTARLTAWAAAHRSTRSARPLVSSNLAAQTR